MKRERIKRRALYCASGLAWLGAGCFVWESLADPLDSTTRTWLVVLCALGGALTTASLFVSFMAPLEHVYRNGYQAGQRANECAGYRPALSVVDGRRSTDSMIRVIPIRTLTHTDS